MAAGMHTVHINSHLQFNVCTRSIKLVELHLCRLLLKFPYFPPHVHHSWITVLHQIHASFIKTLHM